MGHLYGRIKSADVLSDNAIIHQKQKKDNNARTYILLYVLSKAMKIMLTLLANVYMDHFRFSIKR